MSKVSLIGKGGSRLYVPEVGENVIEIVEKSGKKNQESVLNKLKEIYG